jgi:hypothetical protein
VTGYATKLNPEQTEIIPANPPVPGFKFLDPVRKNFAPRFGFAYRITEGTVARGGFGIYYNPNQMNSFTFLNTNPPFTPVVTFTSVPTNPTLSLLNPTPTDSARAATPPNVITIGPELPTPRMHQWSFSLERELWANAGAEIQYLGSRQLHLDRSYFNNTPLPGPGVVNDRRPNRLFTVIRTIQNDLIANYQGLSLILRQRTARGLQILAAYSWSHTLDVTTDSNGGGAPMDPYNWRLDYGNASWDVRHRLVASYNYELPFFRQSAAPLRAVLGGWQINGITILQSGFPINVTIGTDVANTGVGNQRPNLVGTPRADCGSGRLAGCITPSAFAMPTQYTYGNAGRNLIRGPKRYTTDLSLFKNFSITERARLQFRAEAFNAFNTPIFSNPQSVFGTQAFGNINSTALDNREIQLALKLSF